MTKPKIPTKITTEAMAPLTKQRSVTAHDVEFGRKIRLRRVELKISQADLGDKLGVSFQQVQKYEKGVNRVGASRLQQIAGVLGVDVNYFYQTNKTQREVESLMFTDSPFSIRLLRAWTKIGSQTVQRQIVNLVETLGGAKSLT